MGTALSRIEPQTLAANWKAISRCWPTVVPGLPPTGAAGVGSLKPSLGPSPLTMTILAAPKAGTLAASRRAARARKEKSLVVVFMGYLSSPAGAADWVAFAPSTQTWLAEPFALS